MYKVTPYHHKDREALREAQLKIELHLEQINQVEYNWDENSLRVICFLLFYWRVIYPKPDRKYFCCWVFFWSSVGPYRFCVYQSCLSSKHNPSLHVCFRDAFRHQRSGVRGWTQTLLQNSISIFVGSNFRRHAVKENSTLRYVELYS